MSELGGYHTCFVFKSPGLQYQIMATLTGICMVVQANALIQNILNKQGSLGHKHLMTSDYNVAHHQPVFLINP
jgi:hypothetical protein